MSDLLCQEFAFEYRGFAADLQHPVIAARRQRSAGERREVVVDLCWRATVCHGRF